jgi:hypothetical protein
VCPKNLSKYLSIDCFPILYPDGIIEPHAMLPDCPFDLESFPPVFKLTYVQRVAYFTQNETPNLH